MECLSQYDKRGNSNLWKWWRWEERETNVRNGMDGMRSMWRDTCGRRMRNVQRTKTFNWRDKWPIALRSIR